MSKIQARHVLNTPRQEVWNLEGEYDLEFEDGVIVKSTKQSIIFNRYCWELFCMHGETPLTSECDISTFLGEDYFNISTPTKFLEKLFRYICGYNGLQHYWQKEPLLKLTYDISSLIYNEIIHRVSDAVVTIDATDFVKVVESEEIKNIHSRILPQPESIELSYRGIRNYVNDPNNTNRFTSAYRARAINDNQANQCIGPRGFVTDLDRTVFKRPILNGFIRGMGNLYELMTESRTAAKSLNATETHIRTSEYASRRIQLLTMSVRKPDPNDCGSNHYWDIYLTEKYLPNLKGIWYIVNDGDELKCFEGNETELINKVVKIRTAFGCQAPKRDTICTKCLGRVSQNFKENSNLGYLATSYLMEKLTQSILSTKHLTHSVKKSAIILDGNAIKFFRSTDDNEIFLRTDVDLKKYSIVLPASKLSKLTDVLSLDHTNVDLNKIGDLDVVALRDTSKTNPTNESVNISYNDRTSTITKGLLRYIKETDYTVDVRGNYIVPLTNWNVREPIFYNPLKETNIITFVNKIASMIEATKARRNTTLQEHFFDLADTIFDQLSCNLTILQIIVYATTSYNAEEGNYRLGRGSPNMLHTNKSLLFRNRSVSQLMVYETQIKELMIHPVQTFSNKYRSNHPMDVLFVPQHIVK